MKKPAQAVKNVTIASMVPQSYDVSCVVIVISKERIDTGYALLECTKGQETRPSEIKRDEEESYASDPLSRKALRKQT